MAARHVGKVAIVTGGSSGIGHAIVTRLAADGAEVAIADVADATEAVQGLSAEVGVNGITVNCVAPGLTTTVKALAELPEEFFRQTAAVQSIKRNGTPEDQAGVVSFLASDDAAFITGQTLVVDGGQART
jgi:NAD(P)-dependent dehydrogenase (short-subunit alcohol dehydrogenase family)